MKTRKLSKVNPILEDTDIAPESTEGTEANIDSSATQTSADSEASLNSTEAATEATATSISPELQKDGAFIKKITKNFQKGNPTIIYGEEIYSLSKTSDGECSVKELEIGINNKFKMHSSALGKKVWEMMVTPKGIMARPSSGINIETEGEATLGDDNVTGDSNLHEIYPLKSKSGADTGALRVKGATHNGNLTSSNGFDEYKILDSICKKNKVAGRKIVKEFLVDSSTINTSCRALWDALEGWGTDEDAIISTLTRISTSENAAGNWMMMLYGWDQNKFGAKSAGALDSIPQDLHDFFGAASSFAKGITNIFTLGIHGMVTQAFKSNIGFNKTTPMYGSQDSLDLKSSHRGLMMDICDEAEDAWKADQNKIGEVLATLTAGLPEDDFCWRLVDSASGDILVSSGDSDFMNKKSNKGKGYLLTAKTFKIKYTTILGDLLGDDDWEGGTSETEDQYVIIRKKKQAGLKVKKV